VERAVVLCQKDKIELADLSPTLRAGGSLAEPAASAIDVSEPGLNIKAAEKELIVRALKEANGNRTMAAKKMGVSRRTLHRKLHQYHLEEY